jgi:hypothetical protein
VHDKRSQSHLLWNSNEDDFLVQNVIKESAHSPQQVHLDFRFFHFFFHPENRFRFSYGLFFNIFPYKYYAARF